MSDPSPNAFAAGMSVGQGRVVVTTGLLHQLSRRELEGVIAHELAHIKNRDSVVATIAVITIGSLAVLAAVAWAIAATANDGGAGRDRDSDADGLAMIAAVIAAFLLLVALPAALLARAALSR